MEAQTPVAEAVQRLFVYGTSLSTEPNARLLANGHFVGPACTAPRYQLVNVGGIPALVPTGDLAVTGELYEVDTRTLLALDICENVPRLYQRAPIQLASGEQVWAYVMAPQQVEGLPRLGVGDWRRRGGGPRRNASRKAASCQTLH